MSRKNSRKSNRKNSRKANRKNSRKASRKASRRNNMMGGRSRKNTRRNNMMGGEYNPMKLSLSQGEEYLENHVEQHGGAALHGAPVDYSDARLLPAELVPSSRTGSLDAALQEIQGMSDFGGQSGGRRRKSKKSYRKSKKSSRKSKKSSRKSKKASRKSKKSSRKSKKSNRKSRRMYGGALAGAPYNSPSMLLSGSQAAKAGTADFSNPLLKY
jgi:hypothetical protein